MKIEPVNGVRVIAFTDLEGLVAAAYWSSRAFGIDPAKSGAHSGEWETSFVLALRAKQVKIDRAAEGFVGELSEIMSKIFDGIQNLQQLLNSAKASLRAPGAFCGQWHSNVFDLLSHKSF